jgi:hypothetical protein
MAVKITNYETTVSVPVISFLHPANVYSRTFSKHYKTRHWCEVQTINLIAFSVVWTKLISDV